MDVCCDSHVATMRGGLLAWALLSSTASTAAGSHTHRAGFLTTQIHADRSRIRVIARDAPWFTDTSFAPARPAGVSSPSPRARLVPVLNGEVAVVPNACPADHAGEAAVVLSRSDAAKRLEDEPKSAM